MVRWADLRLRGPGWRIPEREEDLTLFALHLQEGRNDLRQVPKCRGAAFPQWSVQSQRVMSTQLVKETLAFEVAGKLGGALLQVALGGSPSPDDDEEQTRSW